jgi:hypothetical protein
MIYQPHPDGSVSVTFEKKLGFEQSLRDEVIRLRQRIEELEKQLRGFHTVSIPAGANLPVNVPVPNNLWTTS